MLAFFHNFGKHLFDRLELKITVILGAIECASLFNIKPDSMSQPADNLGSIKAIA